MPWQRPETVSYPTVWYTFKARDPDSDQLVTYRVEDLTEDRFEDAIQLYTEHFLDDEPLSSSANLRGDPVALSEIGKFWRYVFSQRMTVVCYKEGSRELVGANLLAVKQKSDSELNDLGLFTSDKIMRLAAINEYTTDTFDVFANYGVAEYLTAYGLAVNTRYRGRGIATEILRARIPICRTFGLRLTATNFTAIGSQIPAAKIGFETNLEVTYDDFEKMKAEYRFPGIKSKSLKLMSLVID